MALILLEPKSRGNVKIQSGDFLQILLVDDGAFTYPADLTSFKNAFKVYLKDIAAKLHTIDGQYNLVSPPLYVIDDDQL